MLVLVVLDGRPLRLLKSKVWQAVRRDERLLPAGEGWGGGEAMVVDKARVPPHLNPLPEGEDLKTGHLFKKAKRKMKHKAKK